MPETIGKYQVLELIGRGATGTIFKARDPVLKRPVALKVISSEAEVTDDVRARFFREAQACARLSHRNIVTVYDMGEDGGRLFIVMELLEGEELRRVIDERRVLALEDKLAVMVQVCDGLHYAHQQGIVHRAIKPGNIRLLHTGQVKILDFGIAQGASIEGGLTRTGPIMGTLRYMSPEQVRGQADHRSDIFSVGAVFYQFLSLQLPFTGENPMQILEQIRTAEPPSLIRLDPTVPPELAAAVERALRKDPAERFPDLATMRAELELVQRGLAEEAQRVRPRVRGQRDQLQALQAALAARVGPSKEDETAPVIDERGGLAAMRALEGDLAGRTETVQAKLARADALAPAFERGTELLRAEQFADAVVELEAVVADMPEHALALDALEHARAQAEAQRRQQLAAKLIQDARVSLDDGLYALCLEILEQAAEILPSAAGQEIASLRQTATAALAEQEAAEKQARDVRDRLRDEAEQRRRAMAERRRAAIDVNAVSHAPVDWNQAEASAAVGEAAFAREAYAEARRAFDEGGTLYRRAEERGAGAQATVIMRTVPVAPGSVGQEAPPPSRFATMYEAVLAEVRWGMRGAASLAVSGSRRVKARLKTWPEGMPRVRTRTLIIAAGLTLVITLAVYWGVAAPPTRLRSEAEEARKHVDASRDRAIAVEANTLARDLFDRAVAKDDEARQLTRARRFSAAIGILREADGRYGEAGRVAASIREVRERADQARTRMRAVKERAAPEAAEFGQALARETEGDRHYARLAFEDAGAKFLAAAQLFSSAVPPSARVTEPSRAEPATVDPHAEIREALRAYARVFETKDLDLLQRIRPHIRPDELSRHRDAFDQTRSYRLNLRVDSIKVHGDDAEARGRREDIVVARNGETFRTTGQFVIPLKRLDDRWTIESIR